MKTKLTILVIVFLIVSIFNSCVFCEKGKGGVVETKMELAEFNEINIRGNAKVILEQSVDQSVSYIIDSNLVDLIKMEVSGTKLEIYEDKCISDVSMFEIRIKTRNLYLLDIDGAVELLGENILLSENIKIRVAGKSLIDLSMNIDKIDIDARDNCELKLAGRVLELAVDAKGDTKVFASELEAKEVEVDISNSATCELCATEKINGDINDNGKLFYKGNPKKVKTDINDSGIVKAQ